MARSLEKQDRARPQTGDSRRALFGGPRSEGFRKGGEMKRSRPSETSNCGLVLLQSVVLNAFLLAERWRWAVGTRGKPRGIVQYLVLSKCSINVCWKICLGISWRLTFANSFPLVLLSSPHLLRRREEAVVLVPK